MNFISLIEFVKEFLFNKRNRKYTETPIVKTKVYSKEVKRAKEWAKANPDKVKQHKANWAKNNPDKVKEIGIRYRETNRERIRERANELYWLNKEHINKIRRERYHKNKLNKESE